MTARISRTAQTHCYSGSASPAHAISSGEVVTFETADARGGSLSEHEVGSRFPLPPLVPGTGNPLTGPVAISGACAGDALGVDLLSIDCAPSGWAGARSDINPLPSGRIKESIGRICAIHDGVVEYGEGIRLPTRPMVGSLGTAPADHEPHSGLPGRHGGNLDHPVLSAGTRVYLPVFVDDALLSLGDVHAVQGDGELSVIGLETAAEVTVRVTIIPKLTLQWPWAVTRDRVVVMTSANDFSEARREAVDAMVSLLSERLGLRPPDALALLSLAGDLRIGQAVGGMDLTLRLEFPRLAGVTLEP